MILNIFQKFDFDINVFFLIFLIQFISYLIVTKTFLKKIFSNYEAIQRVHQGEILRIGGLIFMIGFLIIFFFFDDKATNIKPIIVSSFIIFIFTFLEDIRQILSPKIRLFILFLGSSIFIFNVDLPLLNILGYDLNNNFLVLTKILFILSLVLLMNGFNFLDGLNGLSSFNFFSILLTLFYIAFKNHDYVIQNMIFIYFLLSLFFFLFNFPLGSIFLGDSGSYLYAFLIGSTTILLFERNPQIPTFLSLLILAYPITEVVFSVIRKLLTKTSPLHPDVQHLHHYVFKKNIFIKNFRNSVSSLLMFPFWLSPLILTIICIESSINELFLYILYFAFYLGFYRYIKINQ